MNRAIINFLFTGLAAVCLQQQHAVAQGPDFTFSYRTAATPTPVALPTSGTSILFSPTPVGKTFNAVLLATNTSNTGWTLTSAKITGADFRLVTDPTTVGLIAPGQTVLMTITYAPSSSGTSDGRIDLLLTPNGPGHAVLSPVFFLSGSGLTPNFVSSYVLNPDGNQVAVNNNDLITFPNTAVKDSSLGTFIISNKGNGTGTVVSVSLSGDPSFRLSALPLLPADVDPQKDLRFTIGFFPAAATKVQGSVTIQFQGSAKQTIQLAGQGVSSQLLYDVTVNSTVTPLPADGSGTITLPNTPVGNTTGVSVRVRNVGTGVGQVSAVTLTGDSFQLADLTALPATLNAGGALSFTVNFTPKAAGPVTGKLRIDDVSINLAGTGSGPSLTFSVGGDPVTVLPNNGTILFPNTTVGADSSVTVHVGNTGNVAASISSINLTGAGYSLLSIPTLPATVAPQGSVDLVLDFKPQATGSVTGSLQVDQQSFTLRGTGNPPPAVPRLIFTGAADTAAALDQPAITLNLESGYALDLVGTLTLGFASDSFIDDPVIQFSSGGRTVNFRIPANTTTAIFGDSQKSVQFQAGTVAGTISLQATLATSGGVNLTPSPAPSKSIVISAAEPTIRGLQLGVRTATTFELLITGYSTTRSVTQLSFHFDAVEGRPLQTTDLTASVDTAFSAWFQNPTSRTFGSQFTASVTISVTGGDINAVQSVTVRATNATGTSTPVLVNLR